ncbi:MAG TPA: HAMP domain-containing sensor histidine kinase [Ktedonobacteraceae bacterium]
MAKPRLESVKRYFWHQRAGHHDAVLALPWWRSSLVGYFVGFVLVFLMTLAVLLVRPPHFVWVPYCLLFVMIGWVWGVSPALVTIVLGFWAFTFVIAPLYGLLTFNIWRVMMFGSFALAQFLIALLVAYQAVQHQRLLAAKHQIDSYARQLERANHRKDLFLIRAAHELRTPLTTILGEAQRVRRSQEKAERTGIPALLGITPVETIETRAQELRALLEVLIDLSRLRAEDAPLQIGPCDFGTLCREVIEKQRTVSGRPLEFTCPPEPIMLHADCTRLSQVVINLVKSAVQYAQENTVITVNLRVDPPDVVLQVQYNVPGLYQEHPEQLSPYTEAMFGQGWGLGLTMSQEIVERHGGHMMVEASDEGITCSVRLPFQTE